MKISHLLRSKPDSTTKIATYRTEFNPMLKVREMYTRINVCMHDYQRRSFSKLRLMSYNLRIEMDRRSRTHAEQRLCVWRLSRSDLNATRWNCVHWLLEYVKYIQCLINFASIFNLMNGKPNIKVECIMYLRCWSLRIIQDVPSTMGKKLLY